MQFTEQRKREALSALRAQPVAYELVQKPTPSDADAERLVVLTVIALLQGDDSAGWVTATDITAVLHEPDTTPAVIEVIAALQDPTHPLALALSVTPN